MNLTPLIMPGSCLCGAIRFTATGPSNWCAHCHCSRCRKNHGAGYVTWVGIEAGQVEIDDEEDHLSWYESSEGARRGFCNRCGTSMFFRSQRWPGELHITLAAFDGAIDRKPQAHAFYDTHVDWMPIDETLAVFRG